MTLSTSTVELTELYDKARKSPSSLTPSEFALLHQYLMKCIHKLAGMDLTSTPGKRLFTHLVETALGRQLAESVFGSDPRFTSLVTELVNARANQPDARRQTQIRTYPNGHFYSPVIDPAEIRESEAALWPEQIQDLAGVTFDEALHLEILRHWFPTHLPQYDYPEEPPQTPNADQQFYTQNTQYSWLDARAYFVFLCELLPRKVIEVGSGFSSLLAADVNLRFMQSNCEISCIEPFPRSFLRAGVPGLTSLIEAKVQKIPVDYFEQLQPGDFLFIDSSHVSKTGSDVNYLYFEVLPRLQTGVFIHIHDIFLPLEYPREWILEENRSWNEQYLLRALLSYSNAFEIVFGCCYAHARFPDEVAGALNLPGRRSFGGSSLWLRKT